MGEESRIISFLYTHDLRGDLHFLPRLFRVLVRLRLEDQRTITLDLGGSCAPESWHCQATDGRSMLVAFEGMNYAAANTDTLPDRVRPHLARSLVTLNAVSAGYPARWHNIMYVTEPQSDYPTGITMVLAVRPHAAAGVSGMTIEFPAVDRHFVGRMRVRPAGATYEIVGVETIAVPPDTPSDPTISGMVDFIESEARQYQKRRPPT